MIKPPPFFSIIIPAYNAEHYLTQTLDSIMMQSFKDYEVIIINDGSKDRTSFLTKQYTDNDIRFFLIDKDNEGVSIARNTGLNKAQGEYVLFVDADDLMEKDTLHYLYKVLQEQSVDILRYEHQTIDENGNNLYPNYNVKYRTKCNNTILSNVEFIHNILLDECFLWVHVFRRSLIEEHQIRFMPDCTYNEDTLFIVQYLLYCNKCWYTEKTLYKYRKYPNAVTASFSEKNFEDVLKVYLCIKNIVQDEKVPISYALRPLLERLGLRLFLQSQSFNKEKQMSPVIHFCLSDPQLIEWKVLSFWGLSWGRKLLPIVRLSLKIKRKFL